jgi:hypothetical protein
MDFFHLMYWNVTYYILETGLVPAFKLAFCKTKCYCIMTVYIVVLCVCNCAQEARVLYWNFINTEIARNNVSGKVLLG